MEPPSGVKSSTSNNTCSSDVFGQNSPRQPFIKAYRAKICLGEARKFLRKKYLTQKCWNEFFENNFFLETCLRCNLKVFLITSFGWGHVIFFHLREFSSEGNTYEKFRVLMIFKILDLNGIIFTWI